MAAGKPRGMESRVRSIMAKNPELSPSQALLLAKQGMLRTWFREGFEVRAVPRSRCRHGHANGHK